MAFRNFKVENDADGIALVTWDIPGRSMNVLDETSIIELEEIVQQTSNDAAVKGVVVTSGKEAFSAGADLSMLEGMNRRYADLFKAKGEVAANQMLFDQSRKSSLVFRAIETSGKPWVAAINGLALGGAFELTLSCHYRVAAENPKTRLGLPEIKVGLFPGAGGTQRVPRIVPPQDAMQMLLKGEAVALDRAKALKLIDAVVPASDLIKAAKDFPDIDFLAYHAGLLTVPGGTGVDIPWTSEFCRMKKAEPAIKNIYMELGSTFGQLVTTNPRACAHLLGQVIDAFGADHVLWGTDSIWYGSPQPQIEAFRAFTITEEYQERFGYPALTSEVKAKIFGANGARVYGVKPVTTTCI